jgi:hemerythrin-like domain-containing protein
MAYTDLAQQTLVENNMLMLLMEGLRNTLAWKVEGTDFARKLSTLRFIMHSLQRHLERVLALEEYDGYMDLALSANPQLGNSVDALRQEHEQFRKEASQIVHRFEHVSPTDGDSFTRICGELVALLNRLDGHNKKEISLMQEVFARDEGGEG